MTKYRWTLTLEGRTYQIFYRHRCYGRHQLWQDGKLIKQTARQISDGFHFNWEVDDHQCEVLTMPSNGVINALLRVDSEPIHSADQSLPKSVSDFLVEEAAWKNLSESLGLEYHPRQDRVGIELFRLIGEFSGLLTLVSFGNLYSRKIVGLGLYTVIRHGYLNDSMIIQTKNLFASQPSLKEAADKGFLEIGNTRSSFCIPFSGKISVLGHEEEIRSFLIHAVKYLPAFADRCEGEKCTASAGETLNTVFVNDIPLLFCDRCISSIENMTRAEYEKSTRFGSWEKGLIASIGIAFVSMVVFALAMYFYPIACLIFGFIAFPLISKPIYIQSNKPNHTKFLAVFGLSSLSLLTGMYSGILAELILASNYVFSPDTLLQAFKTLISNEYFALPILLIFEVIYLYSGIITWRNSSEAKKHLLHPEIEVLNSDFMK